MSPVRCLEGKQIQPRREGTDVRLIISRGKDGAELLLSRYRTYNQAYGLAYAPYVQHPSGRVRECD